MTYPATGTVLSDLKTALAARGGLSGVTVQIVATDTTEDRITLLREIPVGRDLDWAALGALRFEDGYRFPGRIVAYRTADDVSSKDADDMVVSAFDRCDTLLAEVMDQLKTSPPSVGDQTVQARVSEITYSSGPADEGGWYVQQDFLITLTARSS